MNFKRYVSAALIIAMLFSALTAFPTGFAMAETLLSSDTYYIDRDNGYIYDVVAGTTASELLATLNHNEGITVYTPIGSAVGDNACLATGYTVKYGSNEYAVIVKGDVTGDGVITTADVVECSRYLRSTGVLSDEFLLAGDIDYDGQLSSNDYLLIKKHMKGVFNVYDLKHPSTGIAQTFTVTFNAGENGSLEGETVFDAEMGSSFSDITVPNPVADSGYVFYGWTPEFPEEVNDNLSFTAVFTKDGSSWHTVSFKAGENGSLEGTAIFTDIYNGTAFADAVTLPTVVANPGYNFKEWSPALPDTVDSSATYTAVFEEDPSQYATVTFLAGNHGSLSGTASYRVLKGTAWTEISVPVCIADEFYVFNSWTPTFPDTITEDVTFTASFTADPNSAVENYASSANGGQYMITAGTIREDFADSFAASEMYGSGYLNDMISLSNTDDNWVEVSRSNGQIDIIVKLAQPITMTSAALNLGTRYDSVNRVIPNEVCVYVGDSATGASTYFGGAYSTDYEQNGEYGYNVTINGKAENVQYVVFVFNMTGTNSFIARFGELEVYGSVESVASTHTISFTAGENGTLSGTTLYTVNEGTLWSVITLPTPVAASGYRFTGWTPTIPDSSFAVNEDLDYTANFEYDSEQWATLSFDSGDGGSLDGSLSVTVLKGTAWSDVQIPTPVAEDGYVFLGWSPAFPDTVTADSVYTAAFVVDETQYATVAFVADANGSLSGQTSFKVLKGTAWSAITVPDCIADSGYKFNVWTPDFPSVITENKTFTASFIADESQYAVIEFLSGDNGTLTGTTTYTVLKGTGWSAITVPTCTANAGYIFTGWSQSFPETVEESATYTASFAYDASQWCEISFSAAANGVLSGTTSYTVLKGTAWSAITVPTYTADAGYKFKSWSPEFPSVIVESATYIASFEYDSTQYATVNFLAGDGGSVEGETSFTVLKGSAWSVITVPTPTATTGYAFSGWSSAFPATVTADVTFTALFELIPTYAVVFKASTGGTLEGDWYFENIYAGTLWGDVVTVPTPVANDGYVFDGWTPSLPDADTQINGDLTYTATFSEELPTVTRPNYASAANGGTYAYLAGSELDTYTDTAFSVISTETYRSGRTSTTLEFGNGLLNDGAVITATEGAWVERTRGSYTSGFSTISNVIVFVVKLNSAKSDIEKVEVNLGILTGATNRGLPNSVEVKYSTKTSMGSSMSWKSMGTATTYENIGADGYLATIENTASASIKYLQIILNMSTYYVGRVGEIKVLGAEVNTTPRKIAFSAGDGGSLSGTTSFTVANGTSWSEINVPATVPDNGYEFSHWSPTLPASTSTITADASYTAVFKISNGEEKNHALATNGGTYIVTTGTIQSGYPDSFDSASAYGSGRLNDGSGLSADADPWVEISRLNNMITITVKLSTQITMTSAAINLGLRDGSANRVLPTSVSVYAGSDSDNLTLFGTISDYVADGSFGYNATVYGTAEDVAYVRFDCDMNSGYICRFGEIEVYGSTGPVVPTYDVIFTAGNNGALTGTTVQTVTEGATWADITLPTPVADAGYKFSGWTPSLPADSDEISADMSFTANFVYDASQWSTVTFTAGANGSLSGNTTVTVIKGTDWSAINVPSPVADSGYSFTGWTPSFPSTVTEDATYTANFEVTPVAKYTVVFTAGAGGALTGTTTFTVEEGTLWSAITVPTPVANDGYAFLAWSPVLPSSEVAITANLTFTAKFEASGEQALEGVININGINASQYISGGAHIYTEAYGQYFTATYWQVFVAGYSEAKGGYIVTGIYAVGDSKSVEVPANGIVVAVHMGAENQEICSSIEVGDLFVLSSNINLDSQTFVSGYSYISVYSGDGTLPDDTTGGGGEIVTPDPGTYQQINYDKVKAMWLSQFDLSGVYMSGSSQRAESSFRSLMGTILDNCVNDGMNTVIVQVRPNGDSMYPSEYYTMSKYVVGSYGRSATYDPFAIIIELAHARSLSVQAWINPLRLMTSSEITNVSTSYKVGEWYNSSTYNGKYVVLYNSYYYLNPAYDEVRQLIIDGAVEICTLYDVDGVHMDDYFYPTTDSSFDSAAYNSYTGSLSLANWRRDNLNKLVSGLYSAIKAVDEDILFGISPAGNMSTVYSSQYADVYTWCSKTGYIDYICPQVYFGMLHSTQGFGTCSSGWSNIVTNSNVTLYVGITLGKALNGYNGTTDAYAGTTEGKYEWINNKDVIKSCLEYTRDNLDNCTGVAFFCYQYFYDPVSGTSVAGTAEERANFLPVLKAMW